MLRSGEMDQIKVPYSAGGTQALGIASAQQRLLAAILREPRYLELANSCRRSNSSSPSRRSCTRRCWTAAAGRGGQPVHLRGFVSEEALNELSRLAAQYSDVNCTPEDIHCIWTGIARGTPIAKKAAQMSNEDLEQYLQSMREKKQGTLPAED